MAEDEERGVPEKIRGIFIAPDFIFNHDIAIESYKAFYVEWQNSEYIDIDVLLKMMDSGVDVERSVLGGFWRVCGSRFFGHNKIISLFLRKKSFNLQFSFIDLLSPRCFKRRRT